MGTCLKKQKKLEESSNLDISISEKQSALILMISKDITKNANDGGNSHQSIESLSMHNRIPSQGKQIQGSLLIINKQLIFEGLKTKKKQKGFDDKQMWKSEYADLDILEKIGIAIMCKKGLKVDCPNQDDYFAIIDQNSQLFGVFDGHGPFGHDISDYVHKNLPKIIMSDPNWENDPCKVLKYSFVKCHNELIEEAVHLDCSISGTTATVAYISNKKLYISHVGDSRAVIAQKEKNGKVIAKNLTNDHRSDLPEESERIKRSGGEIRQISGDTPYRVFVPGQSYPGLSMSRAIGDTMSSPLGVICEPEVKVIDIQPNDVFILLCSDGIWEFITSQEAVDIVYKAGNSPTKACNKLLALAWMRWKQKFISIVDDITILLVYLNR